MCIAKEKRRPGPALWSTRQPARAGALPRLARPPAPAPCLLLLPVHVRHPPRVSLVGGPDRAIDVLERLVAEFTDLGLVLLTVDVGLGLVQGLDRLQEAAAVLLDVDLRVVVEILAVIDRRALDLTDRGVDLGDRNVLVARDNRVTGWC